jgi:hypothetical protein
VKLVVILRSKRKWEVRADRYKSVLFGYDRVPAQATRRNGKNNAIGARRSLMHRPYLEVTSKAIDESSSRKWFGIVEDHGDARASSAKYV